MRYNLVSSFTPENSYKPDDLVCASDISIDQLSESETHKNLINSGKYTQAGQYLESSSMDSYCASLFNMIENRIKTTQVALKDLSDPRYIWFKSSEPEDVTKTPVWNDLYYVGGPINDYRLGFRLGCTKGVKL